MSQTTPSTLSSLLWQPVVDLDLDSGDTSYLASKNMLIVATGITLVCLTLSDTRPTVNDDIMK